MSGGGDAGTGIAALARVDGLRVGFGARSVVEGVSFTLEAGRAVALVGESGSGKSVTARALVGLVGPGSWVAAEALEVGGASVLGPVGRDGRARGISSTAWRRIRGRQVGLVVQDALVSLDPLRPVGREIDDALRLHTALSPVERRARVLELLERVGMPDAAERVRQRSGELSGGLRQRALIASALAASPGLLIADEPTTALDATVQARILDLFERIRAEGTGLLFVSHDLAVVSRIADEVLVMQGGRVVEQGATAAVLGDPQHPYTKALLRAVPTDVPRGVPLVAGTIRPERHVSEDAGPPDAEHPEAAAPVLEIAGVTKRFGRRVAVDGVSLALHAGRTLGLVGESGSGKTTVARIALGLTHPDAGTVTLDGAPWVPAPERRRRPLRPQLGAVYQDPLSSFDPRLTVRQILRDALGDPRSGPDAFAGVEALLDEVGLAPDVAAARPLQLSGGQRQRVAIARALAPGPRVLILDEPVSALDVSIQAQILDLLDRLQRDRGLAYLFISHDLGVIRHMSDEVAVMHDGHLVERAPAATLFDSPTTAYARALLAASPRLPHER